MALFFQFSINCSTKSVMERGLRISCLSSLEKNQRITRQKLKEGCAGTWRDYYEQARRVKPAAKFQKSRRGKIRCNVAKLWLEW